MKEGEVFEKIVPDTSVIIEGLLSSKLGHGSIIVKDILIHEAVLAELEHQANEGKAIGFLGLDELKRLRHECDKKGIGLHFKGMRPKAAEIRHASLGEIDAMIRQLAYDESALLMTSDKVQNEVALAKGMQTLYYKPSEVATKKLKFERFFDELTMSVHLRENVEPYAKRGKPGSWEFKMLRKGLLKREEIQDMSREIIEECKLRKDGFIEIERLGSTIVQLGNYRIVITKPPFSDGWEITAVKPVRRLSLKDYAISDKLHKRIVEQAEGILVAGAPGMGKSTFVQALAELYASQNKVIKTVEAPRDLVLPESITQYAISYGDAAEVHDVLLLTRPDYTLFDEMRNTKDFELFADLRLAGVGMVGVVHATNPVDAVQRFIGRVEMGVIPQVIDTVIFIKNGAVEKVLSLAMTVKVPAGMTEADLARPVVVINDFETGRLEYEIYSYGEQTVVVPVKEQQITGVHKIAEGKIRELVGEYAEHAEVEVVSDHKAIVKVAEKDIPKIIGKQGTTISKIEEQLGMSVEVLPLSDGSVAKEVPKTEIPFELEQKNAYLVLNMGSQSQYKDVDVYIGDEFLITAKAGKTGLIEIKKSNDVGKRILHAINEGKKIRILI
jgi:ATPase